MSDSIAELDVSKHHLVLTGGTGFLGGHILNALHATFPALKITVLDLPPTPNSRAWIPPDASIGLGHLNVTSLESVMHAFEALSTPPTIVVHTAGVVPTGNDRYLPPHHVQIRTWEINVRGTENVLRVAKESGVQVFIYTGSCTMITDDNFNDYPNMNEETTTIGEALIYGKSKGVAESIVLAANSPTFITCGLRPSVILGPGDYQLVPTIHRCIEKFETPFVVGSAVNLYDFTFVTNVADAHALALHNLLTTRSAAGQAFFIANGEPIPFRDFCLAIWAEFGHCPPFEIRIPVIIAWLAGWLFEIATWILGSEATLSRGSVRDYTQTAYADLSKARKLLGYEPRISLRDGIRISCKEYGERLKTKHNGERRIYGSKHVWSAKTSG